MMSAELGTSLEQYVADLVARGRYGSKSEVLREGVRLVQDRENERAALTAMLDEAINQSETELGRPADEVFSGLTDKYEAMVRSKPESTDPLLLRDPVEARWLVGRRSTDVQSALTPPADPSHPHSVARDASDRRIRA